jgi:cephalosporin hydroxylase
MPLDPTEAFAKECRERVARYPNSALARAARAFMEASTPDRYSYNFSWLGRPIIQYPQDIVAMQELIWRVKPDLIIETGIAHGGSLILSASMLALLEYAEAVETGGHLDPGKPRRRVLGIDIDIRAHNLAAIKAHPMSNRIEMVQGSSIQPEIIAEVRQRAASFSRVFVSLDSNHTHAHVLSELNAYASLVSMGSYCVVFDTIVEDLPGDVYPDRPWSRGNSPKTAVREYLKEVATEERVGADGVPLAFEVDHALEAKLLMTVAPDGHLRRVPK